MVGAHCSTGLHINRRNRGGSNKHPVWTKSKRLKDTTQALYAHQSMLPLVFYTCFQFTAGQDYIYGIYQTRQHSIAPTVPVKVGQYILKAQEVKACYKPAATGSKFQITNTSDKLQWGDCHEPSTASSPY